MAKQSRIPALCHHKASHLAVVRIGGKDHYLGRWNPETNHPSHEALAAYFKIVTEWLTEGRHPHTRLNLPHGTACKCFAILHAEIARSYTASTWKLHPSEARIFLRVLTRLSTGLISEASELIAMRIFILELIKSMEDFTQEPNSFQRLFRNTMNWILEITERIFSGVTKGTLDHLDP